MSAYRAVATAKSKEELKAIAAEWNDNGISENLRQHRNDYEFS